MLSYVEWTEKQRDLQKRVLALMNPHTKGTRMWSRHNGQDVTRQDRLRLIKSIREYNRCLREIA